MELGDKMMKLWIKLGLVPVTFALLTACSTTATEPEEVALVDTVEVAEAPSIANGDTVETTIPVEHSATWVEEASEFTEAVSGDDYVLLDRGVMTVEQINFMLKHLPMELTFADENSQFLYYNHREEPEEMIAARAPEQVGDSLTAGHPEAAQKNMQRALDLFYAGEIDVFQRPVQTDNEDEFIVITYQGVYDDAGEYRGITQYAQDIQPLIDFYLEQKGMKLIEDPDAVTGATANE